MNGGLARTIRLPDGESVPQFGFGTWRMGEARAQAAGELAALRAKEDEARRAADMGRVPEAAVVPLGTSGGR